MRPNFSTQAAHFTPNPSPRESIALMFALNGRRMAFTTIEIGVKKHI